MMHATNVMALSMNCMICADGFSTNNVDDRLNNSLSIHITLLLDAQHPPLHLGEDLLIQLHAFLSSGELLSPFPFDTVSKYSFDAGSEYPFSLPSVLPVVYAYEPPSSSSYRYH